MAPAGKIRPIKMKLNRATADWFLSHRVALWEMKSDEGTAVGGWGETVFKMGEGGIWGGSSRGPGGPKGDLVDPEGSKEALGVLRGS